MKKLNKIVLALMCVVIMIICCFYFYNPKLPPINEQIKQVKQITESDYSRMGNDYTEKIFDKYDSVVFGAQRGGFLNAKSIPIEWIVLEKNDETALLVSKYIIDCKPFDYVDIENLDKYDTKTKDEYKDISWSKSSLRKWLNEDFLKSCFNDNDQKLIVTTFLDDSNTEDKIFCLSEKEYQKFFDNGGYYEKDRSVGNTKIYYNGATIRNEIAVKYDTQDFFNNDDTYNYWLRDKNIDENEYGIVFGSTSIVNGYGGISFLINNNSFCGVRPAMRISVK